MAGRYCTLEKLDVARHGEALRAAYAEAPDDRDWTYLFAERPTTAEGWRQFFTANAAPRDPYYYAIIDHRTGQAVGLSAYLRIDPANGVIEVGHVNYAPRLQRTPAGTEAQYLLMRRAFDELGYRRYEWKCDALNAPSRAAALRYGFTFEGLFRQAIIYKGRTRDTTWFSIIDREWPQRKAAFESWLEPGNFDAAGRQRRSLAEFRGGGGPEARP